MSKAHFTVRNILLVSLTVFCLSATPFPSAKGTPIVITSESLTALNKTNKAIFEGSVTAKSDDITIYSDAMEVTYSEASQGSISDIRIYGNVRVSKGQMEISSEEATYFGQEEKIVFTGSPRAVQGENVIAGSQIIYFIKEDRTVVKDSRVVLRNHKER